MRRKKKSNRSENLVLSQKKGAAIVPDETELSKGMNSQKENNNTNPSIAYDEEVHPEKTKGSRPTVSGPRHLYPLQRQLNRFRAEERSLTSWRRSVRRWMSWRISHPFETCPASSSGFSSSCSQPTSVWKLSEAICRESELQRGEALRKLSQWSPFGIDGVSLSQVWWKQSVQHAAWRWKWPL